MGKEKRIWNPTLYGLKRDAKLKLVFDLKTQMVSEVIGLDIAKSEIEISEHTSFNIPTYILINGIPIYPSKYEFLHGSTVIYSSFRPPSFNIELVGADLLHERIKEKKNTIGIKDLLEHDKPGRKRNPSQNQVMGKSARQHIEELVQKGILKIGADKSNIDWHWCHLISFRFLPTEKAQSYKNLFCATSACNGHMTNIESAVKRFIYEFERPLGLEVMATTYKDTEIAQRIRYRIFDKKGSQLSHTEYFDALTEIKTDILEHHSIYERMKEEFDK